VCVLKKSSELTDGTGFDTSFHSAMPPIVKLYALPESIRREGVRRYGFHGLSYEYILLELERQQGLQVLQKRMENALE